MPHPPDVRVLAALDDERRRGFDGLAGSHLEVTLPVRQAAVDAALAEVRWPAPLEALAIRIGPDNLLHLAVDIRIFGFLTPIRLRLRVAPVIEQGMVRLWLDDSSLMARAVSWLGPVLARLPPGVRFEGTRIDIDVRRLAGDRGMGDLASMMTSGSCSTESGVLWLTARIEPPASTAYTSSPAATTGAMPFDFAQVLHWLEGARVQGDVHIDNRLANDLVGAAHADVRAAAEGDPVRTALVEAIQPPVVRFEQGVVIVSTAAVLSLPSTGPETSGPVERDV